MEQPGVVMGLERATLAEADQRIRAELDHGEGVQLVKVPVSAAVWSTWRRYCELVGVTMGQGISLLVHNELAAVADTDVEGLVDGLRAKEAAVEERSAELAAQAQALEAREHAVARREQDVRAREQAVHDRERARVPSKPVGAPPVAERRKLGRNDPCWCGSGRKYKVCHLVQSG